MPIVSSATNVINVLPSFKTMSYEPTNKLFYGVELEVEVPGALSRYEVANKVYDLLDKHAITKEEGTVAHGFEIVTIPATLDYHRHRLWADMFNDAKDMLATPSNCGMHIHFSRDALTETQLAKAIYFIHETDNSGFLSKIAGRRVWRGAGWCAQRKKTYSDVEGTDKAIITSETGSRTAIGVSNRFNGKSVEVRIFQAKATKAGVLQGVEFLDCLIRYTAVCGNKERDLTYKGFMDWYETKNIGRLYPIFHDNLLKLEIVEPPRRGVACLLPKLRKII